MLSEDKIMAKYIGNKVFEAFQMTHDAIENRSSWPEWLRESCKVSELSDKQFKLQANWLYTTADIGDYIIKSENDEVYTCAQLVFEKSFTKKLNNN